MRCCLQLACSQDLRCTEAFWIRGHELGKILERKLVTTGQNPTILKSRRLLASSLRRWLPHISAQSACFPANREATHGKTAKKTKIQRGLNSLNSLQVTSYSQETNINKPASSPPRKSCLDHSSTSGRRMKSSLGLELGCGGSFRNWHIDKHWQALTKLRC